MRELIRHPSAGEFTQGSIFEGLKVNENNSSTIAIIITARCDIANGKARNILCLPIYKAAEWLKKQGDEIIFRKVEGKLRNKLELELKKFNISIEILDTYPVEMIIRQITKNAGQKNTEEIKKLLNMHVQRKCDYSLDFVINEKKNFNSSLIRNTESSIYFIEQVHHDEILEPYVIDLAEPISIPFSIATKLKNGISKRNIDDLDKQYVTIENTEISYISVLSSPYIEHLLQKFASFYSRIGTEDIDRDASNYLKEKLDEV